MNFNFLRAKRFVPCGVPSIFGAMKTKLLLSFFVPLSLTCYGQHHLPEVKKLDSLTKIINDTFRQDLEKKDSGSLVDKFNKVTGKYEYFYFINKKDSTLRLVVKNYKSDSSAMLQESFYYWNNRPITVFRIYTTKEIFTENAFYFINDKVFEKTKALLAPVNDEIKNSANENLKLYTKLL